MVRTLLGLGILISVMTGCKSPNRSWVDPIHLDNWPKELSQHPMAPDQNVQKIDIGGTENASHHLIRVRDREPYHLHAKHDVTVFILAGQGDVIVDGTRSPCSIGNILFIPHGVPHAFINTGDKTAVAYAIFTPAMLVQDMVILPEP